MGVLPSTQPVATLGSSFILSSFDHTILWAVMHIMSRMSNRAGPRVFTKSGVRGWLGRHTFEIFDPA